MRQLRNLVKSLLGREVFYPVDVSLPKETLGSAYGGWAVAPGLLTPESVVYSFGIGEDISFDLALIERCRVKVHAFDPTPRALQWVRAQTVPDGSFFVHDYGLAGFDGQVRFFPPKDPKHISHSVVAPAGARGEALALPVQRLSTIMQRLGHRELDLLKMDIEGAEYDALADILDAKVPIKQLLVEFHHRFHGIGLGKTKQVIAALRASGFRILAVSPSGQEYSFVAASAIR